MKPLFVVLVALFFAFLLGCQSTITDPVVPEKTSYTGTAEDENFAYKDAVTSWPGRIVIENSLFDPSHPSNNSTLIDGILRYKLEKVNAPDIDDISPKDLKVSTYLNAELKGGCPGHNEPWRVYGFTEDIFKGSASNQIISFEKTFRVQNTCCRPLKLVLKFQLYEDQLVLVSMGLKVISTAIQVQDWY